MIEKTIYLEGIDPLTFYGTNNKNLDKLKSNYPKLRVIGRGVEIKVIGDQSGISRFEDDIDRLLEFVQQKNQLSEEDIDNILSKKAGTGIAPDIKEEDIIVYGNQGKAVQAKTVNQKRLVLEYGQNDLIFAIGPAGTGKTYTAIALAVRALKNKEVKRVILTRPAVEAGEKLGFLPGDMKQKLDPYLQPLYDALGDMIPHKKLESYIEEGVVEIAPLAYMRGRTLGDAFVILDEGQNTTVNQLKMFLTRMGKNAKFIVTGDITQIDLPERKLSGLIMALKLLSGIKGISVIEFDTRDIVRHRLVKHIVHAYENNMPEQE
ncbi:MAG: family ATPase [Bacteroidetes bacterium]|jgi:phosphate starvation-inducible PhoH-like protein|nr:family ATPase [Bacteroidota bacterium]MBS1233918.1 family ATPase [Bacteroidota bacterium]